MAKYEPANPSASEWSELCEMAKKKNVVIKTKEEEQEHIKDDSKDMEVANG